MRIYELIEDGLRLYAQAAAEHEQNPSERTLIRRLCAAAQVWGAACATAAILHRDDVDGHTILARYGGATGKQVAELVAGTEVKADDSVIGEIISES
jgi:hypothetical protein